MLVILLLLWIPGATGSSSSDILNTPQGFHASKPQELTSETAKASAPPTIANRNRHRDLLLGIHQLSQRNLGQDNNNNNNNSNKEEEISTSLNVENDDMLTQLSDMPKKMQRYVNNHSLKRDESEMGLQHEIETLPRSIMAGAPDEANLLCLLLEMMDARTVVEVGVFRGITTLTLALCLKRMEEKHFNSHGGGGDYRRRRRRVIGLDVSEEYAEVGKKYWSKAGVDDFIDFRVGDAKDSLKKLLEEEGLGENSVDMCFIDADKVSYDEYYETCLRLTKSGGLIIVDNTLWAGRVLVPDHVLEDSAAGSEKGIINDSIKSDDTKAIKALNKKIFNDTRVERVCFLTIADGVTICRKK